MHCKLRKLHCWLGEYGLFAGPEGKCELTKLAIEDPERPAIANRVMYGP